MAKVKKFKMKDRKMTRFDAMPKDKYLSELVDSEWKETKSGDSEYLKLEFEVIKGEYKGRKLFENLNLKHDNPDVVRIAEGVLADLNRACGFGEKLVDDTEKLHNIPVILDVGIKKDKEYGEGNKILAIEDRKATKETEKGKGDKPVWQDEEEDKGKKDKGKKKDKENKKDKGKKKGKKKK